MRKVWLILGISGVIIGIFILLMFAFFPKKYYEEINNLSIKYNLPSSLIASVINIESGYDVNAVSDAGAMGLMQLLPSTAEDCCNRMRISYAEENLFKSSYNMEIGCYYLRYLLDMFSGNIDNVLCAYNWGLGNVKEWIDKGNVSEDGTIINIPIRETRRYLKKYAVSNFVYSRVYGY